MSELATIATYSVFVASYVVFALGKFPGMKIDRPGAAIIGAVLMFMTGAVRVENSLRLIHFGTIVLLFSMMLVVAYLHLAGDGSVCAEGNRATGDQASSLSPSRGNGVKHRKHGDDHRQPAKHPDWIFLRYRLPGFSLALGSGCSGGSLPRLARVVVALLSSANP